MKSSLYCLFVFCVCIMPVGCKEICNYTLFIKDNFEFTSIQLKQSFKEIELAIEQESEKNKTKRLKNNWGPLLSPRSIENDGSLIMVSSNDWTSGFFPGELWYMYEYTGDDYWKEKAQIFTAAIEREKTNGRTHDMGFKMFCSFGNAYRLTQDSAYRNILIEAAYTLTTRFQPKAGIIRSWDHNKDKWQCPVIIDNMMNLELLFWAFKETNDSLFYNIAVSHAEKTIKNHFRDDYSSYHVIDYDTITGDVRAKHTHQGYSHESAWSRGQAWGLYGYTMCYRETGKLEFLEQAKHIADYIFSHPNMPKDLIPYWDFDAPEIPNEPRDVSAATVIASALFELMQYDSTHAKQYSHLANTIMQNLTKDYRADLGTSRGFLLLHSTGHKPKNSEVDVPLVYADYYFLEALLRLKKLN